MEAPRSETLHLCISTLVSFSVNPNVLLGAPMVHDSLSAALSTRLLNRLRWKELPRPPESRESLFKRSLAWKGRRRRRRRRRRLTTTNDRFKYRGAPIAFRLINLN